MKSLTADDPLVIGEYRLRGQLGHGGMGRVYLGTSPGGRAVAVKVLHPELARDGDFLHRFEREVAAARAVSGIYTAPVVATGLMDRLPWLATAYVAGPSLDQLVREHGPLPEAALWPLFTGLVEALSAIHDSGIVHRDLKPSNVLVALDGPRVIDFGISRATDGTTLTATGTVFGSPGYMSPEQAQGKLTGPAADVFSLGSLVVFAATGVAPFGEGNAASVLYRVVHDTADLTALPPDLRDIVAGCLAKDPAARTGLDKLAAELARSGPGAAAPPLAFWPAGVAGFITEHQVALETRLAGDDTVAAGHGAVTAARTVAERAPGPVSETATDLRAVPTGGTVAGPRQSGPPAAKLPTTGPSAVAGGTPPRSVAAAVRLMYAGAGYALFFTVCAWLIAIVHSGHPLVVWQGHWTIRSVRGLVLLGTVDCSVQAALWLAMAWACERGRSWARAACTALFACYTLGLLDALARHTSDATDRAGTVLFAVTWLIGAAAIALLWRRGSAAWFRGRASGGGALERQNETVAGRLEAGLGQVTEHVRGHVGEDDAPRAEAVPMGHEVGVPQVVRHPFVPVVRLGDEQVGIGGRGHDGVGPRGVAGVGD